MTGLQSRISSAAVSTPEEQFRAQVYRLLVRFLTRPPDNSDPILADLDGLNEYDEGFTDAALAVKALKRAYKVGGGFLTDEERKNNERDASEKTGEREEENGPAGISGDGNAPDSDDTIGFSHDERSTEAGPEQQDTDGPVKS